MAGEDLESGLLQAWLKAPTVAVRSDGRLMNSSELSRSVATLAQALQAFRNKRVALVSSRAENIWIALAASEAAACEILLLRTDTVSAERAHTWKLSASIDSSLITTPTGVVETEPAPSGFRILIATSGTTGEPKVARHSIRALLGRVRAPEKKRSVSRWLLTYHPATFGGLQVLLTALAAGDEIITVAQPTVPALCEAALAYHPTHVSGTPTFWRSFLLCLGPRVNELDLRQITLGGEITDEQILERLRRTYPSALVSHIYASTEAGALFSVRDGLAGFPASWLETGVDGLLFRIQDGVLQVKSPRSMDGYVGLDSSRILTSDGWLITGDLVDVAGERVFFRGREDLTLNVGGAKVRPEEVEQALLSLPEVVDAQVYGARNPLTGFLVAANVVPRAGIAEADLRVAILTQLRAKLEAYKVPRKLRFVDSISMSMSGKKEKPM